MPLLFSYGTLQDPAVQLATFARLLQGHRDTLVGFRRTRVAITRPARIAQTGRTHDDNASYTGNAEECVDGTLFEVSDEELAAADVYERDAEYVRVRASVASGRESWVYVHIKSVPPPAL
jgi:gamma-glutamylcyclotransferase (GGCT)/AIG2-like uncharacterized protein YtfP